MWGEVQRMHTTPWVRARARRTYWEKINPSSGRPSSASSSKPDNWGITAASKELKQHSDGTTIEELQEVFSYIKS
ncbi:betaine--homocysteine S-methyltransferase 1-like [Tachypleus tridentatus]|uniref:betaine--homocysteine S-methyltransferase 1-like n=1 Tax=Tachypleus tridentatus TaxID=6853 RepID=UPI003FD1BF2D